MCGILPDLRHFLLIKLSRHSPIVKAYFKRSSQPWRLSSRSFAPSGEFINRAALSHNKNEHNIVFHRIDNPVIPDAQFVKPAYRHAPEANRAGTKAVVNS